MNFHHLLVETEFYKNICRKKEGNRYYPKLIFSTILLECGRQQEQWVELFTDPAKLELEKYEDHSSIASIKNKMTSVDNLKSSLGLFL